MIFNILVREDKLVVGFCTKEHLALYTAGKGCEQPTEPTDKDVYCVGCGKFLCTDIRETEWG